MEAAVTIRSDRGETLVLRRVRVHLEFASQGMATGIVALTEDPVATAVLAISVQITVGPDDHEVAIRVGGDGRPLLPARRVRVHLELAPQRIPTIVVALAENAPITSVLSI